MHNPSAERTGNSKVKGKKVDGVEKKTRRVKDREGRSQPEKERGESNRVKAVEPKTNSKKRDHKAGEKILEKETRRCPIGLRGSGVAVRGKKNQERPPGYRHSRSGHEGKRKGKMTEKRAVRRIKDQGGVYTSEKPNTYSKVERRNNIPKTNLGPLAGSNWCRSDEPTGFLTGTTASNDNRATGRAKPTYWSLEGKRENVSVPQKLGLQKKARSRGKKRGNREYHLV